MKDYLKEELTQDERLFVLGIIWKAAKKFKVQYYANKQTTYEIIENLDLYIEDTYQYNIPVKIESLNPLTEKEKCNIVIAMDYLLKESGLFELIRTLNFNEKLVFFLYIMEEYKMKEVSMLLGNPEKTIFNRRKSIENKIKKMKGEV